MTNCTARIVSAVRYTAAAPHRGSGEIEASYQSVVHGDAGQPRRRILSTEGDHDRIVAEAREAADRLREKAKWPT
jgi:hypothetical protein